MLRNLMGLPDSATGQANRAAEKPKEPGWLDDYFWSSPATMLSIPNARDRALRERAVYRPIARAALRGGPQAVRTDNGPLITRF